MTFLSNQFVDLVINVTNLVVRQADWRKWDEEGKEEETSCELTRPWRDDSSDIESE